MAMVTTEKQHMKACRMRGNDDDDATPQTTSDDGT